MTVQCFWFACDGGQMPKKPGTNPSQSHRFTVCVARPGHGNEGIVFATAAPPTPTQFPFNDRMALGQLRAQVLGSQNMLLEWPPPHRTKASGADVLLHSLLAAGVADGRQHQEILLGQWGMDHRERDIWRGSSSKQKTTPQYKLSTAQHPSPTTSGSLPGAAGKRKPY